MYHKDDIKKKVDQNLKLVIKILNTHKINYWICHGTLLGIIRDKKILPWDNDIDIGLIKKKVKKNKLISLMKKNGFNKVNKTFLKNDGMLKFSKKGGKEIDFNLYEINKKNTHVYVKWLVPRNLFMRIIEVLSFSKNYKGNYSLIINLFGFSQSFFVYLKKKFIDKNLFYSFAGYSHKANYAFKLKNYNFFGLKILVPYEYKKYLEDLYGSDWQTPKRNFNWTKHSPSTKFYNDKE